MKTLLYISASPRGQYSYSQAIAGAFVDTYRQLHPEDRIITHNVFETDLPDFGPLATQAKFAVMHGQSPSAEEKTAWLDIEAVIQEFVFADKYVFAVPMWNFGIPYRLKQYIDILVQPTYTFNITPDGHDQGLITGKPVFITYARGGAYPVSTGGDAYDFQQPYLETLLRFIGLTDFKRLLMENTLTGDRDETHARRTALAEEARKMAKDF